MRAIQVTELTGPANLSTQDIPTPTPGPGEVLIQVDHAGVTFPELLQTRGMYQTKHELPYTLGSEGSGTIIAVGPEHPQLAPLNLPTLQPGDRVAFIAPKGAWAEQATAPITHTVKIPDTTSFEAAAGMPMNLLTADFALRHRGNLQAGQTLLIHGAAGGLGSALVQLGCAMGAEVIAVVSTDEKANVAKALGAHHVIKAEGFRDSVKALFPRGVDLIADPVGGDRFTDSLRCLKEFGTLLVLGFTAGSIPEVQVNRLLLNNISVAGVAWGAATLTNPGLVHEQWAAMRPHLEAGTLDPHIHQIYPLAQAADALAELDGRSVIGKILLKP